MVCVGVGIDLEDCDRAVFSCGLKASSMKVERGRGSGMQLGSVHAPALGGGRLALRRRVLELVRGGPSFPCKGVCQGLVDGFYEESRPAGNQQSSVWTAVGAHQHGGLAECLGGLGRPLPKNCPLNSFHL